MTPAPDAPPLARPACSDGELEQLVAQTHVMLDEAAPGIDAPDTPGGVVIEVHTQGCVRRYAPLQLVADLAAEVLQLRARPRYLVVPRMLVGTETSPVIDLATLAGTPVVHLDALRPRAGHEPPLVDRLDASAKRFVAALDMRGGD
jgi:hypothetical protein